MEADIVITIALVSGAVLIINQFVRLIRNASLQRTIRDAIVKDSPAVSELIARMDETGSKSTLGDERAGLVLIALSAALALFGWIAASPDDVPQVVGLALFPGFVGIALFGWALWVRRRGEAR